MNQRLVALALSALTAMAVPAFAQGEGNGLAGLTTGVNGAPADNADKILNNGDFIEITLASSTGLGTSPILATGRISCQAAQPAFDFGAEVGIIGLDLNGEVNVFFDGFAVYPPIVLGPTQSLTLYAVVPAGALIENFDDLMIQGACGDPTAPQGFAVSNAIRHESDAQQVFDSCAGAACSNGIDDSHLGVLFSFNTGTFTNDVDTTGLTAYSTQTSFNVVAPGSGSGFSSGTGKDAFIKFTATAGGNYTFDMCASTYDSRIWLMPVTCALPVAGIAHNDDASADAGGSCVAPGHSLASRLRDICLNPGQQVLIVVDGFGSSSGLANLTITRAPFALASATPSSGAAACAPNVTITGTSFLAPIAVDFSGNPGTVVSNTCSQIVVTPPALGIGSYDINVLNGDAAVGTLVGALTLGGTSIDSVAPSTVAEGCPTPVVTINGAGFLNPVTVDFSGSPATVVTESCTQVVVTAPTLLQGAYDVTVTNNDATTVTSVGAYVVTAPVTYPVTGSLPLSDDGSSVVSFNCGNTFKYYGVTYGGVTICMNGRLQFGSNGNTDWSESTAELRTQSPSICVFWDDCFGSTGAPASLTYTETATNFSVTYANVPRYTSGSSTGTVTLDFATGEITMSYGAVTTVGCITGVSPGASLYAVTPAETDLSTAGTFTAAAALDPVYEIFAGPSADSCDLSGLTFGFTPTGGVGVGPYMFHNP